LKALDDKTEHRTLVIGIYSHIEFYPPSLNALFHLAPLFEKVYVLVRNVAISDWEYPSNVVLIPIGKYIPSVDLAKLSSFAKLRQYISYGWELRRTISIRRPSVVLLYDTIAFSLFNTFAWDTSHKVGGPIIWYHNHDITVESEVGKFSFMRLMRRLELRYLNRATFFSLPNHKRLKFFPVDVLSKQVFIIPNYPSRFFFGSFKSASPSERKIRLIFQGHISNSNRIEEFIGLLTNRISDYALELHLAGPINPSYQALLEGMANSLKVSDRLFIYGRLPYRKLPELTASCHIGLAIYGHHNTMVRTMSTASNKIFEYASVGLPVIINEREDLQKEFQEYSWIHFIGEGPDVIGRKIELILRDYEFYSNESRKDFEDKVNFEVAFQPVLDELKSHLTLSGAW
jgi:hypothetical protein